MTRPSPITHGGPDRRRMLCRCSVCRLEAQCTPHFDFYTPAGNDSGPLRCEGCMRQGVRDRGLTLDDRTPWKVSA